MLDYDTIRIIQDINVFQHKINEKLYDCFSGMNLNPTEAVVLYYILNEEKSRTVYPKDISKEFGLSYSAISQTLKRLKLYGYINDTRASDDARFRKVTATEKAKNIEPQIKERLAAFYEYLNGFYMPDEIKQLRALLERF